MTQYVVALTGGIGSGKSTIANKFSALGVPLVDADLIARQVIKTNSTVLSAIVQNFGQDILYSDGSLNRAVLRTKIFCDSQAMVWLNNLLHPLIRWQTEQRFCAIHAPYLVWVVPLLIENNLQCRANRILLVDVDPEIQIARTLRRDIVKKTQVENILAVQASRQQHLACADDIVDNRECLKIITDRVAMLHQCYLKLAASTNKQDK